MIDIGALTQLKFAARSHGWARAMNQNLIKQAMTFGPAVESMTTNLPASAPDGTMYIDPTSKKLCMWLDAFDDQDPGVSPAGWYAALPSRGLLVYVRDQNKYYMWNYSNAWELAIDVGATHRGIEREFAFYAPGLLRPSSTLFYYVAGLEFTLQAGAPNSGAHLETAPTSQLVLPIKHQGVQIGTITFATGSTSGVVAVPVTHIVQPTNVENMYQQANVLEITSPANVYGAVGLSVTLRGMLRAID